MGEAFPQLSSLDRYKPLRDLVFEQLREAILVGLLRPGERLMEIQLAEQMGVSRTPVREALRKLELEGLVVMVPRKGAYVADLSVKDIAEVFEIRAALEGLAASLAALRATQEELDQLERHLHQIAECLATGRIQEGIQADVAFHDALFSAARNGRLKQLGANLREQVMRFRVRTMSQPARMRVAIEEHRAIVEAIAARDPELARQRAEEHIESAENSLMELIGTEQSEPSRQEER